MPIYFAQATDGGPIKIGCSVNVPFRIKQLEAHYGQSLALLATMPGGVEDEKAIHARFAGHRLGKTEQFQPVAEIMAFIGRPLLVAADPDAVEVMPKAPPRKRQGPGGRPNRGRIAHLYQRVSPEWLAWVNGFAAKQKQPVADLIAAALEVHAKLEGYKLPPNDEEADRCPCISSRPSKVDP